MTFRDFEKKLKFPVAVIYVQFIHLWIAKNIHMCTDTIYGRWLWSKAETDKYQQHAMCAERCERHTEQVRGRNFMTCYLFVHAETTTTHGEKNVLLYQQGQVDIKKP
jgi:hypothetical protein